jgi:hypothetical protein
MNVTFEGILALTCKIYYLLIGTNIANTIYLDTNVPQQSTSLNNKAMTLSTLTAAPFIVTPVADVTLPPKATITDHTRTHKKRKQVTNPRA